MGLSKARLFTLFDIFIFFSYICSKTRCNQSLLLFSTMKYDREYTPEFITSLKDNEIFVFGSNIRGMHGGGAARAAWQKFDAEWGVGEGLTGKCYALPTMEGGLDYIQGKVNNFIACAKSHPELKFYVTKVACGIAGFSVREIGPLFKSALPLENVILPKEFVDSMK